MDRPERLLGLEILELCDRRYLPAILERDSIRRIHEFEHITQGLHVERGHGSKACVVQERGRELRHARGDCDYARVTPVQLGHEASCGVAMHAFRIVKKEKNLTLRT